MRHHPNIDAGDSGWFSEIKQRAYSPLTAVVNIISLVFGVVGTSGALYVGSLAAEDRASAANWVLVLMLVALAGWILGREFYLARKERYANIWGNVRSLSAKLAELDQALIHGAQGQPIISDTEVTIRLQGTLDDFKNIFSMLTGTHCRACLKIPQTEQGIGPDKAWVVTYARDTASSISCRSSDDRRARNRSDLIVDNSDFLFLFDEDTDDEGYVCVNNIPKAIKKGAYQNSSVNYTKDQLVRQSRWHTLRRGYVLTYRSAITWAVRGRAGLSSEDEQALYAFLSVDSESTGVFKEKWDAQIGCSVAERLSTTLSLWSIAQEKQSGMPHIPANDAGMQSGTEAGV